MTRSLTQVTSSMVFIVTIAATLVWGSEPLTFEERVSAQEAIDRIYYNQQIWPKGNPSSKPPFEEVVSRHTLEAKVTDYLRKSFALGEFWRKPITGEQLQTEVNRMARRSQAPNVLRELFAALNNDPRLIAECLARPVLADRQIRNLFDHDTAIHAESKRKALRALERANPDDLKSWLEVSMSRSFIGLKRNREGGERKNDPPTQKKSSWIHSVSPGFRPSIRKSRGLFSRMNRKRS
jgi:hypothetical protein